MTYTTLISVAQLQELQASGQPLMVFDCSFDLMNPQLGPQQFAQEHIEGAVYANLDTVLSSKGARAETGAASGGRHPLPARETFANWLTRIGFGNGMQAVVYDRQGVNYCGRLWWMLKWLGHEAVAVLDGGLQAWQAAGGNVASGDAIVGDADKSANALPFMINAPLVKLVQASEVLEGLTGNAQPIVDARGAPRFRGEVEPIDPVAGHIPGALNRPFTLNIGSDGRFKPAEVLRAEFEQLLGQKNAADVVHHCGSGVSAVPNIIAMEVAGLGRGALFAGSWSEWCSDPTRPVAQG
jgi:thiosulfate/3-mercaptopyruvate sulfurtransferase